MISLPSLTYGVEEEFVWTTRDHKEGVEPPIEQWQHCDLPFTFGREAHQCVLETISPICDSLKALAEHIRSSRDFLTNQAKKEGSILYAGGTHPFIDGLFSPLTQAPYYQSVIDEYGFSIKQSFVFGQHIHIGSMSDTTTVNTFNKLRPYLPLLLALSANSRMWRGEITGLECTRLGAFSAMPRTGIPPKITNLKQWMHEINTLLKLGVVQTPNQFWYDARVHATYRTIEVRVMDMQTNPDLAVGIALFTASLVTALSAGVPLLKDWAMPDHIIATNRWQAIKHGMYADFITRDYEKKSVKQLILSILEVTSPYFQHIDSEAYFALLDHVKNPLLKISKAS